MFRKKFLLASLLLNLLLCACQPQPTATLVLTESPSPTEAIMPTSTPIPTLNTLETIAEDMSLPHEAPPHGVPGSFDWAKGPRLGMGNEPGEFRAVTAWGQVYEAAQGNPAVNTRVQIRNIRTYILSRQDGLWHLVQSSTGAEGAAYVEDFAGDVNKPPETRREEDGSLSVKAGGGYNFHFWPTSGRAAIDPGDIAGVFTTVQARLIVDDPSLPDDRSQARYLLSMGADYWLSLSAQWDEWKTNGDVGIGRFKVVTSGWRAVNMTTLDLEALLQNPPPLE
jgi:hypothetical protein